MKREDFRRLETLRVRWAEVDAQQVVFNGHYLMYVDVAMAGWWRALAVPYPEAMLQMGGDLYVRKATLEYEAAARYDERLAVGVRCNRIGSSSMQFHAAVFRNTKRLVQGELIYVYADPTTMRSQPVPAALRAAVDAFEAGEPMLQMRCGDWSSLGAEVQTVRAAAEGDSDPNVVHAVAFNRLGAAVATARMRMDGDIARTDGRHTLAALRGAGHGTALQKTLQEAAMERGCRAVRLDGADVSREPPPPSRSAPRVADPGTSGSAR